MITNVKCYKENQQATVAEKIRYKKKKKNRYGINLPHEIGGFTSNLQIKELKVVSNFVQDFTTKWQSKLITYN